MPQYCLWVVARESSFSATAPGIAPRRPISSTGHSQPRGISAFRAWRPSSPASAADPSQNPGSPQVRDLRGAYSRVVEDRLSAYLKEVRR